MKEIIDQIKNSCRHGDVIEKLRAALPAEPTADDMHLHKYDVQATVRLKELEREINRLCHLLENATIAYTKEAEKLPKLAINRRIAFEKLKNDKAKAVANKKPNTQK